MIDMTSHMLYQISNLNSENQRIAYQMSSGRVLNNGSDDSVLYAQTLDIENNLRVYEGLKVQVEKTASFNNVSDSTVDEIKSTIDMIKVDLIKSLNAGVDTTAKAAIATNLTGLRENLISITNTRVNGEYLFAGSDTTKETFTKGGSFESDGKVDFGGDGILRKVAIEPNTYRERGITAYDVMMYNSDTGYEGKSLSFSTTERVIDENGLEWKLNGTNDKLQQYDKNGVIKSPVVELEVSEKTPNTSPATYETDAGQITGTMNLEAKHNYFDDLNIMINALNGYKTNADGTKDPASASESELKTILQNSLDQTTKQFDASNIGHAELGGRNNIFEIAAERIEAKSVHYNILMQEVGGADLSKLAMESKSLEMTYQALYSTISKMSSLSLLNYIK